MNPLQHIPVITVVLPLVGAFAMPLLRRRPAWTAPAAFAALAVPLALAAALLATITRDGPFTYYLGGWPPPWGIELRADPLRLYMVLVLLSIGLWILTFAFRSLPREIAPESARWYYTLYLLLMAAMIGMAFANDLFNLFVLMEIAAIASCAIISIKAERACQEAAFKYLILSAMGTGCYLLAVALIYMVTGHLNIDLVRQAMPAAVELYPKNILLASSLLVVAFGTKAALFPLHAWLPDAHSAAPSPSSAVLSGLVIKIYAFVLLVLMSNLFTPELRRLVLMPEIILWLGTLSVIYGSLVAMVQTDLKRMLAYSSIAQIGYIFMGIGLGSRLTMVGGLYHLLNHGIMKALLFMAAGAIISATGLRKLQDLSGLGRRMPLAALALTVGGASMIGLPGTGGLIGKWYLALGALESGRWIFVVVILLSSLLNAAYYLPVSVNAYLKEPPGEAEARPVPVVLAGAMALGTAAVIFFGIFPRPVLSLLERAL